MDEKSLLKMEMQKRNRNAFTLVEMLIVLLIVSIVSIQFRPRPSLYSLTLFMNQLKSHCIDLQQRAFIDKRDLYITFDTSYVDFDGQRVNYPKEVACTPKTFHYNSNGNISNAQTITCKSGNLERKLIFQLGQGRVRIE